MMCEVVEVGAISERQFYCLLFILLKLHGVADFQDNMMAVSRGVEAALQAGQKAGFRISACPRQTDYWGELAMHGAKEMGLAALDGEGGAGSVWRLLLAPEASARRLEELMGQSGAALARDARMAEAFVAGYQECVRAQAGQPGRRFSR